MNGHGGGHGHSSKMQHRIENKLLEERKIYLWGAVQDESARSLVDKLLYLNSQDPEKPITFYVNSPGGVITSGMAVIDTMQLIPNPVHTVCMGLAASMGAMILLMGERGHRYAWPHARIMIHQPLISGRITAPALDLKIHAEEIKKTRDELNRMIAEATGKDLSQVENDTDRDRFFTSPEAKEYGLIDHVVTEPGQM